MNYAEFITMLSNFQLASFNVGFEMAKNNNTKELEEQVSDMFILQLGK